VDLLRRRALMQTSGAARSKGSVVLCCVTCRLQCVQHVRGGAG
jgi:hypothetical protein